MPMNDAVRKRELKQFRVLLWLVAVLYPVWFVYGVWSGNYNGPIIVGAILAWAVWYIKRVITKIEKAIGSKVTETDWYALPIQQYVDYSVLILSLATVMLLCVSLLVTLNLLSI